ncbi:MAG: hypothetical protein ACOYD4_01785 [Solirubrobacterales bacterium]
MPDLSVNYAGLELKNPIITAASSLGNNVDKLKRLEEAGAGAVTTKLMASAGNPPMHEHPYRMLYRSTGWMLIGEQNMTLDQGLKLVRAAKEELEIPVIANTMQDGGGIQREDDELAHWVHDCLALQEAGADAIEMDLYPVVTDDRDKLGAIVKALLDKLDIPVIPKLNPSTTPVPEVAKTLVDAGAKTITMANCFWGVNPGVDIYNGGTPLMPLTEKFNIGAMQGRYLFPLQNGYLGLLKAIFGDDADIGSGGGVYTWDEIVQRIMLGAQAVQLCSTIYENGPAIIQKSLDATAAYMDELGYERLDDFRGLGLDSGISPVPEDPSTYDPAVARIKDRAALVPRAEEIVQKVQGDCLAMSMGSDGAPDIDEDFCTGCGWCVHHAGDGSIELVKTDKWVSDLDARRVDAPRLSRT